MPVHRQASNKATEISMDRTYTANFRVCATCTHWFGPRSPMHGGKQVLVQHDARAACNHPNRLGMTSLASDSCGRWQRLGTLR